MKVYENRENIPLLRISPRVLDMLLNLYCTNHQSNRHWSRSVQLHTMFLNMGHVNVIGIRFYWCIKLYSYWWWVLLSVFRVELSVGHWSNSNVLTIMPRKYKRMI